MPGSVVARSSRNSNALPLLAAADESSAASRAPFFSSGYSAVFGALAFLLTVHAIFELWTFGPTDETGMGGDQSVLRRTFSAVHACVETVLPVHLLSPVAQRVFWCGWVTAACTALGAVPFLALRDLTSHWVARANATAAGMMLAAAALLVMEGALPESAAPSSFAAAPSPLRAELNTDRSDAWATLCMVAASPALRTIVGVLLGCAFVWWSQALLHTHEHLRFSGFEGTDARRVLLILGVMTVHSLAEGVGLGVAFSASATTAAPLPASASDGCGTGSLDPCPSSPDQQLPAQRQFGVFISAALAMHNIPEGLAIALVLVPRGVPLLDTALWCIFTSLPQPLMALPAFLSVQTFASILPWGMGWAAGAMLWVAVAELLAEAATELGQIQAGIITAAAAAAMFVLQELVR